MTDYTYDGAAPAARSSQHVASAANWVGAGLSLALIAGVGVWGYKLIARDVSGVPVVQASSGPMRVAPADPGGELALHQGLAVNRIAGVGTAAPPADRLVLAPRAAGLGEEDVALGLLPRETAPRVVSVTPTPGLADPADAPSVPALAEPVAPQVSLDAEEDPIEALANMLAAGAPPLSELAPASGNEVPLRTQVTPVNETVEDVVAAVVATPAPTGPGLARSLRPRTRPQGLQLAAAVVAPQPSTATAPAAAAPVGELEAASLPLGTRLVQIGAFDSPETARAEWARLEGRFGDYLQGKDRVIQRATSGGRVFYRLRAHGFVDLSDARRFCAAFVAENVDCIPVVTR